jgi:hypothetical protein
MNKVAIIGIRGLPAKYGAFDQFVNQFVNFCNLNKKKIFFYISADNKNLIKDYQIPNVSQFYFTRGNGIFILFHYLISIIFFYFKGVRIFLFFGYGAVIFFPILKLLKCKIICNVDGIEWRRKISKIKKIFFKLCENLISLMNVDLIFDSKVIERYYARHFGKHGSLIYYPSDFADRDYNLKQKKKNKFRKAILVMRFVPENNIKLIVEAFSKLNNFKSCTDKLYIIGSPNKYFNLSIKPIIKKNKNIVFLGSIYDRDRLFRLWLAADYYIHGHSVGGTNPTLIEALSIRKPVIAYKCSFNKIILGSNAYYFKNIEDLTSIILKKDLPSTKSNVDLGYFSSEYVNNRYINLIKN